MRLWFSVAVLLILACVVLEASAAKSSRDKDATKGNQKSVNAKEVRYTKSKSGYKKKGNGEKQEVVKDKKRRHVNVEENQKINPHKVLKKNQNDRNEKVTHEEQKRQKPSKQNKVGKTSEKFKNNQNIDKVAKDTTKRQKRSLEVEQVKENLINEATISSTKNEETKLHSASKKVAKSKLEKKSVNYIEKSLDGEPEGEAIVKTKKVSQNKHSEETAPSLDVNVKSSKKNKNGEEQQGDSKKTKKQKINSHDTIIDRRKNESKTQQIQTPETPAELEESEYFNDLSKNSYYLNEDGLIKEKKASNENAKKYKFSKKSSKTSPKCANQINDELPISDQKSETCETDSHDQETDCSVDQTEIHTEKSKYFANDVVTSNVTNMDQNLTEEI